MDICDITNKTNFGGLIRILQNGNTFKTKIILFWPLCCESEAILSKNVRPGYPGWSVHINFHPGYRDLGRKTRDLGNRASPASHMNTSKILRRKEWRGEVSETEPARLTGLI